MNFSPKVNLQATSSPGRFSLALEVGHTSKAREKRPGDEVDLQVFLCINVSLQPRNMPLDQKLKMKEIGEGGKFIITLFR